MDGEVERDGIRWYREGAVAHVVLDRPPVNAFASSTYDAVAATFNEIGSTEEVSVIVVRSANPRVFCAGADLKELDKVAGPGGAEFDVRRQGLARACFDAVVNVAQPTVAVVNGPALGAGAVLASCCDLRLASPGARFALPEINVGRAGGTRHMLRHLPQGIVRQMCFTGEAISVEVAERFGFVNAVHADDELLDAALALASEIATKSPFALRLAKESMNAAESLALDDGYATEQGFTLRIGASEDGAEAVHASLEKRPPTWVGR